MTSRLSLIGAGYSVSPLIPWAEREGWHIYATTRSEEKADHLSHSGAEPILWEAPATLPNVLVDDVDVILISVAPHRDGSEPGCPVLSAWPTDISMAGKRIVYLSSTGVYGDYDGAWVDETSECHPTTERGRRRLAAERAWQARAAEEGASLSILRLAGIYGPSRNALESLMAETAGAQAGLARRIIKSGQVFNRIHRDDIVETLKVIMSGARSPDVLNVTDNEPSPPQDVVTFAAEILEIEPPPIVPFEEAELSPMARSFYAENKRLKNERLKAFLGKDVRFPTYREGLRDIARTLLSERATDEA